MRPQIDSQEWRISNQASHKAFRMDADWRKRNPTRLYRVRTLVPREIGNPPNVSGVVVVKFLPKELQLTLYGRLLPTSTAADRRWLDRQIRRLLAHTLSTDRSIELAFGHMFENGEIANIDLPSDKAMPGLRKLQ